MISWICGVLREVELPLVLVDVSGVGYEMMVSLNTASVLPSLGAEVGLWTSLLVRDDGWHLYGFASKEERTMFSELLKVGGVGPKSALALLSHYDPKRLAAAIAAEEVGLFTKVSGIGSKTASRIVVDLKGKLPTMQRMLFDGVEGSVFQALLRLGYKNKEAESTLQSLGVQTGETEAMLLKRALKRLSKITAD